jgi:hypothetical protein
VPGQIDHLIERARLLEQMRGARYHVGGRPPRATMAQMLSESRAAATSAAAAPVLAPK